MYSHTYDLCLTAIQQTTNSSVLNIKYISPAIIITFNPKVELKTKYISLISHGEGTLTDISTGCLTTSCYKVLVHGHSQNSRHPLLTFTLICVCCSDATSGSCLALAHVLFQIRLELILGSLKATQNLVFQAIILPVCSCRKKLKPC